MPWEYASASANLSPYIDWYENDTQTRVMVEPGGQTQAGITNLYLVLANASELSEPAGTYYYEMAGAPPYAGDIPLPPQWLQINGKTLVNTGLSNLLASSSGNVWGAALVSGLSGKNVDVTPVATNVYQNWDYTFNVQAYQVGLKILDANGMDLTLQTNTVIVGQQMNLSCKLTITNSFMTNYVFTNFAWTVPGYAISNYIVAADTNSAVVVTNFPTTNATAKFYWVDGASNRVVRCSATVNGMLVTGQATFNIFCPLPSFYLQNQSSVAADTSYNVPGAAGLYLYFGQDNDTNVGIAMTLTNVPMTNGNFYGGYFVTQLIQTDQKINVMTRTNVAGWQRDRNGLDNSVKYPLGGFGDVVALPSQLANNPIWTDSPGSPLGSIDRWIYRSDSFKSYLMFQPAGSGSIPVPMFVGTWGWSGSAKTNGVSGGTLLSHSITSPTVSATTSYPVWTTNSVNVIFANPANWDTTNLPAFNEN